MNCFPCFQKKDESNGEEEKNDLPIAQPKDFPPAAPPPAANDANNAKDPFDDSRNAPESENTVKSFTFRELATATKNFRGETLLGEGGFGKVFKGTLGSGGQIVAVRQLDRNAGGKDFVFEVSTLSLLQHPNLVKMVGYCADGEQRLLVYEYLSCGPLESHLFDLPAGKSPLDWNTRMKIALGIAEGLEYLHEKADPHLIYRDLKSSNVLLNEANIPKLSDCGVAKLVQNGQKMHVSVMAGYNGYCAPEYERNGELTFKSDVYSFGVVLLELITGRRALDTSRPADEQSLVSWAQPIFRDPSKFPDMADPLLRKGFSVTSLNQAVGVAAMCLQEEPSARPFISDISAALSFLAMAPPEAPIPERLAPMLSRVPTERQGGSNSSSSKRDDSSDSSDDDEEDDSNKQEQDERSESDYEYGDSSDGSDYEEEETMAPVQQKEPEQDNKVRCKSTKSKKLGSSSKRRSKKKTVKIITPKKHRHSRDSDASSGDDDAGGSRSRNRSRDASSNSGSDDDN